MSFREYWEEVWARKGDTNTLDLRTLNGYEATTADSEFISNFITNSLCVSNSDKVLDIGCGAGMLSQHIAKKCIYSGVDKSQSLIDKHIKILGNNVKVSEANDLPFRDKEFDVSFSFGVFHYFPDESYVISVIREMIRVTKFNIFIGDLPVESKRPEHTLFNKKFFERLFKNIEFSTGLYEPNAKYRFNVLVKDIENSTL